MGLAGADTQLQGMDICGFAFNRGISDVSLILFRMYGTFPTYYGPIFLISHQNNRRLSLPTGTGDPQRFPFMQCVVLFGLNAMREQSNVISDPCPFRR